MVLTRILADPRFIYRIETEPAYAEDEPALSHQRSRTLASRLSFFLWSSVPDDELIAVASQGTAEGSRGARARRCGACSRIPAPRRLTANFAGQWLNLRGLQSAGPLPLRLSRLRRSAAPGDAARSRAPLRQHHPRRSQRDRPADGRRHLRQRTAGQALRHPERLRQPVPPRDAPVQTWTCGAGCSAKARSSSTTSKPERTSPVTRGKWIMTNILGVSPPDPPPDVPPLPPRSSDAAGNAARADDAPEDGSSIACGPTASSATA